MWLFSNPKSYPEMLKKIAWTMFFFVFIGLIMLSSFWADFSDLMSRISLGLEYEQNNIKFYISYLYIPLVFALFENIFKLHDRISDLFGIRYRFDKNIIIHSFLKHLKMENKIDLVNRKNRDTIMGDIFYKYAGYADPKIDPHLIYMALGAWSWYWILIDTTLVSFFLGIIYLIFNWSWGAFFIFGGVIIILYLISFFLKHTQCVTYAKQEVESILEQSNAKIEINNYIRNTLSTAA